MLICISGLNLCLRACKFIPKDGWASSWHYLRKYVSSRTKIVQSIDFRSDFSLDWGWPSVSYFWCCHEYRTSSCIAVSSPAHSTSNWFARPCYLPSEKDDCTCQNHSDAVLQGCIACFCGIACAGSCKKMCADNELGMTGMTAYDACVKEHIYSQLSKCSAWHTFDIMDRQATLLVNTLWC